MDVDKINILDILCCILGGLINIVLGGHYQCVREVELIKHIPI